MSTHDVKIVKLGEILEHPNADALEKTMIGNWQVIIKKGQFKEGDRAVYIEPDYVIPTDVKYFSFLAIEGKDRRRLKAIRLRGEISYGLLIPVPDKLTDKKVGDNVIDELNITRYEPPAPPAAGADVLPKENWPFQAPKFDVENINKFDKTIKPDEEVVATEKIHGANSRFTFDDKDQLFKAASRTSWLKEGDHIWSRAAQSCPQIEEFCKNNPGYILYGEVYGPVQSLRYGQTNVKFIAFALLNETRKWVNYDEFIELMKKFNVPVVAELYRGPFKDLDFSIAEEDSVLAKPEKQVMEGIVITPVIERTAPEIGRVTVKHISNRYWLKK